MPAESSVWDRISTWVSENKAVVYTIAGVTVVVAGATVYYYTSDNSVRHPALIALVASGAPATKLCSHGAASSSLTLIPRAGYITDCLSYLYLEAKRRCAAKTEQEGEEEAQGG